MPKKESREQVREKIIKFFKDIGNKTPRKIKKIKKLAMHYNIKLGQLRKNFCKKCYSTNLRFKKIKKVVKTVICRNCGYASRWKLKA